MIAYRLIGLDVDKVLVKPGNFWMELHRVFGTLEQAKPLNEKFLIPGDPQAYNKLIEAVVVELWKGKDAEPYFDLVASLPYNNGIGRVFEYVRDQGLKVALVSASSYDLGVRIHRDFKVDHIFANKLIIEDGKIAGRFDPIVGEGTKEKARIMANLCEVYGINRRQAMFVGDGNVDVEAASSVGFSVAFNSTSEKLRKVATRIVDGDNLENLVEVLPR